MFMNTSIGITYSLSNQFTITNSSAAANGQSVSNKPTASLAGAPSPTETWALAFDPNGKVPGAAPGKFASAFAPRWWIGALGLVGAGAVSLL